jgi:hypothetical protein
VDGAPQRPDDEGALMGGYDEVMNGLRAKAQQVIGDNALVLAAHRTTSGPATAPEKRWWDLVAKYRVSNQLADELKKAHRGRNDHDDALRHAEWSEGMTQKVGPLWSGAAGIAHEIAGLAALHPLSESVMDIKNNSEGIQAALQRRPIDAANLQDRPMSLTSAYAASNQRYEDTTPDRAEYPSRPEGQGTSEKSYKDAPRYEPQERYRPYR